MMQTGLPTGIPRVSLELAAREWGAARGVLGRRGGYLYTADRATYDALPLRLRGGSPDQRDRLALVDPHGGYNGPRAIQGWHTLGILLRAIGQITTTVDDQGHTRFLAAAPAPAAQQ